MPKPQAIVPLGQRFTGINILIHGHNGVGKTPLIGTSQKALILDADGGTDSARASGSTADRWPMNDWSDMQEAYEWITHNPKEYRWVWLDSIPGLMENTMEGIMLEAIDKNPTRSAYVPDKREYLINMNRLKEWVRHMRAAPINFGMVTTTMELENPEQEGNLQLMPWIPGKGMIPSICGHANIIGYLEVKNNPKDPNDSRQVLYCRKNERFFARDRFDALPRLLVNPTIPKVEQLVKTKLSAPVPAKVATAPKSA